MMSERDQPAILVKEQFLEIDDVAGLLRVSRSVLAKWRMRGRGPRFIKAGRRILYRQSDIAHWLCDQTHDSTAA